MKSFCRYYEKQNFSVRNLDSAMEVISCYSDNIQYSQSVARGNRVKVGVAQYPYRNREALRNLMAESWARKTHEPEEEKPKAKSKSKVFPVILLSLIYLLILGAVPYFFFQFEPLIENRLKAEICSVEIPQILEAETNFIDNAMNHFVLDDGYNIDYDGNVVLEDGTVLVAEDFFTQPVSFREYTVKNGDTIDMITYRNGLRNISTLIAVNEIYNVRTLRAGQKLRIPSIDGLMHFVAAGDSLNSISVKYHVSVEDILDVNDLISESLNPGQELFIPGAKMDSDALRKAMGELFIYPLSSGWRLTSAFGARADPFSGAASHHYGIDMAAPLGTPVKAAMSGKVVTVATNSLYGNYVVIDHLNGYQTLYGHMKKSTVKNGARVAQGEQIGLVGMTGQATGSHLHFTLYKNGNRIDPMPFLKGTKKL